MKLYLDNSFLNRPFDNPNVRANRLEAEILFFILDLVKRNKVILINSAVIEYENSFNPFPERKIFVERVMRLAKVYQNLNEKTKQESEKAVATTNLRPIDSLHIGTAEFAKVDFFITCDYSLISKYTGSAKVIKPVNFILHYENHNH